MKHILERYDLRLLLGIACGIAIGNFVVNSAPQVISSLMHDYGMSEGESGIINSIEMISIAVSCAITSMILPRFDHKKLVLTGVFMVVLCGLLGLTSQSTIEIQLLRALSGIGAGIILATASSAVSNSKDPDRLYAEIAAVITVVMTIVIVVLSTIKETWGYAGMMLFYSTFTALCCIPMLKYIPRRNFRMRRKSLEFSGKLTLPAIFGVISIFIFSVMESSIWNFSGQASLAVGLSESEVTLLLAASLASGLLGAALAIILGKVVGRSIPILFGCLTIGACGYTVYNPYGELYLVLAVILFNLAYFFVIPFIFGACSEVDLSGSVVALGSGMAIFGAALGPAVAGKIIDQYELSAVGFFCLMLAFASGTLGMAMDYSINAEKERREAT